jgi:hypothetical protein
MLVYVRTIVYCVVCQASIRHYETPWLEEFDKDEFRQRAIEAFKKRRWHNLDDRWLCPTHQRDDIKEPF